MDVDDSQMARYLRPQRTTHIIEEWQEKALQEIHRQQTKLHQVGVVLSILKVREGRLSQLELQNEGDKDKMSLGMPGESGTSMVTRVKRSSLYFLSPREMETLDGAGPAGQGECENLIYQKSWKLFS